VLTGWGMSGSDVDMTEGKAQFQQSPHLGSTP
jgi:hypothetical protein